MVEKFTKEHYCQEPEYNSDFLPSMLQEVDSSLPHKQIFRVWGYIPTQPQYSGGGNRRLRHQSNHYLYTESSSPAWDTWDPVF